MINAAPKELAVYLHWPYCKRICPYCDFNVYKARGDDEALAAALVTEIKEARCFAGPRRVTSVHFGGGTPSLMRPAFIAQILSALAREFNMTPDIEIGLEANPADMDVSDVKALSQSGVNRLSFGVQSFDNAALHFLGRDHNGVQAEAALRDAIEHIPNISADLIFGYDGHNPKAWSADIAKVLAIGVPHISAYQLTIEPGTAFDRAEIRGQARAVGEDMSDQLYRQVREAFLDAGFEHYEVSNFARPGHQSTHNLAYWTGRDYLGLGPGAHGRVTRGAQRYATETYLRPADYITSVKAAGHGRKTADALSPLEHGEEYVLMGLRIKDGISLPRYSEITGQALTLPKDVLAQGWLVKDGERLMASPEGRLRLDYITSRLLT